MTDQGPPRCRTCGKVVRLREDNTAGRHKDKKDQPCTGAGLPPHGDPPCLMTCRAIGTVGWPPVLKSGEAHASTHVCDSPSHQDEASRWVYEITGHAGVFKSFADARAEQQRPVGATA